MLSADVPYARAIKSHIPAAIKTVEVTGSKISCSVVIVRMLQRALLKFLKGKHATYQVVGGRALSQQSSY
jgi:hypothetical protein